MKVFLFRYMTDPAKIRHRIVISTPMVKLLLSATKHMEFTSLEPWLLGWLCLWSRTSLPGPGFKRNAAEVNKL